MVYLPTFGWFLWQMYLNVPLRWMLWVWFPNLQVQCCNKYFAFGCTILLNEKTLCCIISIPSSLIEYFDSIRACYIYLYTFTIKINQMQVDIPYADGMGLLFGLFVLKCVTLTNRNFSLIGCCSKHWSSFQENSDRLREHTPGTPIQNMFFWYVPAVCWRFS